MNGSELRVALRLLQNKERDYVGFQLLSSENRESIFSFLFDFGLTVASEQRVSVHCMLVKGFPSHDAKCALMISGQSSASSAMPCLRCIADKTTFASFRHWMATHRANEFSSKEGVLKTDPPIRAGDYLNTNCYETFRLVTGDGMFTESKTVKTEDKKVACSVVKEPLA